MIFTDVVDCTPSSCNSNGRCIEVVGGGFVCKCEDGWRGSFCDEEDIDACLSEPCENGGSCNDGLNNYTCSCFPPWEGDTCTGKVFLSPCNNPCQTVRSNMYRH